MSGKSIRKELERTRDEILSFFDLEESALVLTYEPGKWSVKELLHHLTDAETVLYERIRRAIAKPGQVVWGFDQDAWAEVLNYKEVPLDTNKAIFMSIRAAIIDLAERFYISKGDNFYIHNETGNRHLSEEFDKVVWHSDHHLDQIRKALKKVK